MTDTGPSRKGRLRPRASVAGKRRGLIRKGTVYVTLVQTVGEDADLVVECLLDKAFIPNEGS
jgi:hypothetical protein